MRKLLPIIFSFFGLPLFAGVEVEYAVLVDEDVPAAARSSFAFKK